MKLFRWKFVILGAVQEGALAVNCSLLHLDLDTQLVWSTGYLIWIHGSSGPRVTLGTSVLSQRLQRHSAAFLFPWTGNVYESHDVTVSKVRISSFSESLFVSKVPWWLWGRAHPAPYWMLLLFSNSSGDLDKSQVEKREEKLSWSDQRLF